MVVRSRLFVIFVAGITQALAVYSSPVAGDDQPVPDMPSVQQERGIAPSDFTKRDIDSFRQDDHIHTTPDVAVAQFEAMDVDGDERVQWDEVERLDLEVSEDVFQAVDADGSGDWDQEEYVAISPSPENEYIEPGHTEP